MRTGIFAGTIENAVSLAKRAALVLCVIAAVTASASAQQPAPPPVPPALRSPVPQPVAPAAPPTVIPPAPVAPPPLSAPKPAPQSVDFADAFKDRPAKRGAADSLEYVIRNDYLKCTGDTTFIPIAQLVAWNNGIDSAVLNDKEYRKKFDSFVSATGIKAHDVRPCEPIVFFEKLEKQLREMDSIVNVERARKEKAAKDSALLANELGANRGRPVDILGIPAGISKKALKIILNDNKIAYKNVNNMVQVDSVTIDSLLVTVAFYFDADEKYNGYEMETAALKAAELDKTVRGWADRFSNRYEKMLGPPTRKSRVGFHDIKPGRLSVTNRWNKDDAKTMVGLATHNNLYYAKVIVNYGK